MTVVLADLLDQADGAEDPEAGRSELEHVRETVARHGGTADELPDGAVLAVFGSPVAHEDDCVRALRAADELRSRGSRLAGGDRNGRGDRSSERDRPWQRSSARRRSSWSWRSQVRSPSASRRASSSATLRDWSPLAHGEPQGLLLVEVAPDAPVRPLRLDVHLVGRTRELTHLRDLFAQ